MTGSTPQGSSMNVAFTPGSDGGSPITGYLARCEGTDDGLVKPSRELAARSP